MASARKTYLLTLSDEIIDKADHQLTLGALMADPRNPLRELNKGGRIAIPSGDITTTNKKDWSFSTEQDSSYQVGVWSSLLAPLTGASVDASTQKAISRLRKLKCDNLETNYFQPSPSYILDSLKHPIVNAFFTSSWRAKPVYMVTGHKIMRGSNSFVESGGSQSRANELAATIDASQAGAPVQVGAKVGNERKLGTTEAFQAMEDLVVAYRLIRIKPKSGDGVDEEDFNKWALMSEGGEVDEREKQELARELLEEGYEVEPLAEEVSDENLDQKPVVVLSSRAGAQREGDANQPGEEKADDKAEEEDFIVVV